MKQETAEWLEQAQTDLRAAGILLAAGDWWTPLFHCQQALETLMKAILVEKEGRFPESHNLRHLARESHLYEEMSSEEKELLLRLDTYYMGIRYPDARRKLRAELSPDYSRREFDLTREAFRWISQGLS